MGRIGFGLIGATYHLVMHGFEACCYTTSIYKIIMMQHLIHISQSFIGRLSNAANRSCLEDSHGRYRLSRYHPTWSSHHGAHNSLFTLDPVWTALNLNTLAPCASTSATTVPLACAVDTTPPNNNGSLFISPCA
jgi:hypothetical protein